MLILVHYIFYFILFWDCNTVIVPPFLPFLPSNSTLYQYLLCFKFLVSVLTKCFSMHMWICICTYIPKYTLLSLYITSMHVFKGWTLNNQLICVFLSEKTTSLFSFLQLSAALCYSLYRGEVFEFFPIHFGMSVGMFSVQSHLGSHVEETLYVGSDIASRHSLLAN